MNVMGYLALLAGFASVALIQPAQANDLESLPSVYDRSTNGFPRNSNNVRIGNETHKTYFFEPFDPKYFSFPGKDQASSNPFWSFECENTPHDLATFGRRVRKGECTSDVRSARFRVMPFDYRGNFDSDQGGNGGGEIKTRDSAPQAALNASGQVTAMGFDTAGNTYFKEGQRHVLAFWVRVGSSTKKMFEQKLVTSLILGQFHTRTDATCLADTEPSPTPGEPIRPHIFDHPDTTLAPGPAVNLTYTEGVGYALNFFTEQPNHPYYAGTQADICGAGPLSEGHGAKDKNKNPACVLTLVTVPFDGKNGIGFDQWIHISYDMVYGRYDVKIPAVCRDSTKKFLTGPNAKKTIDPQWFAMCKPSTGWLRFFINDKPATAPEIGGQVTSGFLPLFNPSLATFDGITTMQNRCEQPLKFGVYALGFQKINPVASLPSSEPPTAEFQSFWAAYIAPLIANVPEPFKRSIELSEENQFKIEVNYANIAIGNSLTATRTCPPNRLWAVYNPATQGLVCNVPAPLRRICLTVPCPVEPICSEGYTQDPAGQYCYQESRSELVNDQQPMIRYQYPVPKSKSNPMGKTPN